MGKKFTNYYEVLGVLSRKASQEDIKKAFRANVVKFHPDKNPDKEQWADEKMKELNEAFEILSNPQKRIEFDLKLNAYEVNIRERKRRQAEDERRLRWKRNYQKLVGVAIVILTVGLLINISSNSK